MAGQKLKSNQKSLRSTTIGNKFKLPQQYNRNDRKLKRQEEVLFTSDTKQESQLLHLSYSLNFKIGKLTKLCFDDFLLFILINLNRMLIRN